MAHNNHSSEGKGTGSKQTPKYITVDNFRLEVSFLPENFLSGTKYQPRQDDVIVATYPKCGTTWMCQIVLLILRKGQVSYGEDSYFKYCPFLELHGAEAVEKMTRPGCIKTHLPFNRLTFSKEAKYIYVARHPKDCVVSLYHHLKLIPECFFWDGEFDDLFELFIRGDVSFNDYFDNLLSWYEHRNEPNVLFTTFENMKADHRGTVLKVAKFLGEEYYSTLMEDSGLLDKIIFESSFEFMSKIANKMFTDYYANPIIGDDPLSKRVEECVKEAIAQGYKPRGNFIRCGKIGEGDTVLSHQQELKLQCRILEKTAGSDVMRLWDEWDE